MIRSYFITENSWKFFDNKTDEKMRLSSLGRYAFITAIKYPNRKDFFQT